MKMLVACLAASAALCAGADQVVGVSVKATDGFGGDLTSVLTRCQTKEGGAYDPVVLSRDVASLRDSHEFDEISAETKSEEGGVSVQFVVRRKMRFVAPASAKGADFFSEARVVRESGLKDGALCGVADLAEAARKVRRAYQKKHFPDAKVIPVTEPAAGGGANVSVTFVVDEGERLKTEDYVFGGLNGEVDDAGLKESIGVYPWWNPAGWFSDEPVSLDGLAQTAPKAEAHLRDLGYLDAKVSVPERVPAGEGKANVVYDVELGPRYRVNSTAITGLTRYSEAEVRRKCGLPKDGDVAGWRTVADAARRIEVAVGSGDVGLADTHVAVQTVPVAEPGFVDVVFKVEEGVPVVINQVVVKGNDYTKDKVIRREITLSPGDRMLEDQAERGKNRLMGLDYFTRVNYKLRKTGLGKNERGEEWRDLVYEVEEHPTGNFMFGVGAGSVDSIYLYAEIQQSNFDIFAPGRYFRGGGQKARVFAQVGPRIQSYELGWTEPWLFDRQLQLDIDAYRRLRWYDDYDLVRTGGGVGLSYPVKFWPTWAAFGSIGARLSGEFIQFDDVERGTWEYRGREVSLEEEDRRYGDAFEPVLRLSWSRADLDRPRSPTSGCRTSLYIDLALAGDNRYWKAGFTHRSYFRPWRPLVRNDNWFGEHVLMLAARAETIDGISDDVPIYNRLFLGGPRSIRGIEYRGVSPYARRTDKTGWTPWGGQTLVCANAEYTVPVVKLIRLAAFTDAGSVGADEFDFSSDFAWTVGMGLRIDIPMLPIRLDFGTPVKKPDHAKKEVFSFSVGYEF